MVKLSCRGALVVAIALFVATEAHAQYSRGNAITDAVKKTRHGVIMLTVTRDSTYGGQQSVAGAGFVVDERGYAITNHHVIAKASRILVTLDDKTQVEATVHKDLPKYDLAILKLSTKKKLVALQLAPASDLMQGETVIAIGNPHGYAGSVSTGIISALNREIKMPNGPSLTGIIQHSASINPGNSGGALLNINGELIGVNVALREGAQSISFAINADTVKDVLSRHLSAAKISKVTHGLACAEKVIAAQGDRQQVIVKADAGGLKEGDVILTIGTRSLTNVFDLERSFWGHKVGDIVPATILRDGKKTTTSITLTLAETRTVSR